MSKLAALTAILALTWGCAQRVAAPVEASSRSAARSALYSQGNGYASSAAEPRAVPPTPAPLGDNATEEPADSSQKLAQARAMGCVGIR